jgi:predicted TIM-barrel fold metal-dependent hydrolase
MPKSFKRNPRDTFQEHVYVAPFYEDDMNELRNSVPVERILFGSDYPHPEGLPEPLDYVKEFSSYKPDEIEKIFSSNLKQLIEGRAH